ncbi:MAG: cyclic lactone autoinducer peptide [Hungatella sp.]|jgi:hypothetical protein|nr:cyclic lactone autoinducer peptide [Hungatella sp.]
MMVLVNNINAACLWVTYQPEIAEKIIMLGEICRYTFRSGTDKRNN